jgi:hypothetical protein
MNGRRRWPWLLVLVAVGMWFGWRATRRQTAGAPAPAANRPPPAPPLDLARHDGAAIDFSSGRPVIRNSPADRAAVARAVRAMDEAAKDVTFQPAAAPPAPTPAGAKPASPASP